MKTVLIGAAALVLAAPAFAQNAETFSDPLIQSGLSQTSSQSQTIMKDCLATDSSSRAVRACTKAIKASVAVPEIRSDLYAKRGLHQLNMGRFAKASKDFAAAGRLDGENALAALGSGFAALRQDRLSEARAYFAECNGHEGANALAQYGVGMSYQMEGKAKEARAAYQEALQLRPGWDAPAELLAEL